MQNSVRWFEIYIQDMNRAKKFYESVFQVKLQKLETPVPGVELWSFPAEKDAMGISGALVKMQGMESGGNSTIVYFGSKDCVTELGRVKNAGGKVEKEKMSIGQYGFIAYAVDTEGNMIGLHSLE